MATVVTELFPSKSGEVRGSIARCTREFHVVGDGDPVTALQAPGIPGPLEEFTYNGIVVKMRRARVTRTVNASTVAVECEFDNDGSSQGPQTPDDTDDLYKDYTLTYTRTTTTIPTFVLHHKRTVELLPDGAVGPPSVYRVEQWELRDQPIETYEGTAEVTVNIVTMSATVQRKIADQTGNLHFLPDNAWWKYVGATITRRKVDLWQIIHRWTREPGHKIYRQPGLVSGDGVILRPIGVGGFQTYEWLDSNSSTALLFTGCQILPNVDRPPFGAYMPKPQAEPWASSGVNPSDYRPRVVAIPPEALHSIDPTGWQGLPGSPLP